jgi:hypothetical protein
MLRHRIREQRGMKRPRCRHRHLHIVEVSMARNGLLCHLRVRARPQSTRRQSGSEQPVPESGVALCITRRVLLL